MNIAAYCRVSTDKEDQLNSLETQKEFFLDDLGLDETVLIDGYENTAENEGDHQEEQVKASKKTTTNTTIPNCTNHT